MFKQRIQPTSENYVIGHKAPTNDPHFDSGHGINIFALIHIKTLMRYILFTDSVLVVCGEVLEVNMCHDGLQIYL